MSKFGPSIEDLIKSNKQNTKKGTKKSSKQNTKSIADNDDVLSQFKHKMNAIKLAEKERTAEIKAEQLNCPFINLDKFPISPEAIGTIPQELAEETKVICFYRAYEEIRIGAIDPSMPEVTEIAYQMKEEHHVDNITIYLISENSYKLGFKFYQYLPKIKKIIKGVKITEEDLDKFKEGITDIKDLQNKIADVTISEIVTAIIAMALQVRASDIHIEAEEKSIAIRYRVDGILNEAASLEKNKWPRITSRIKLLSNLKLNISNKPQDGRFTIFLKEDKVDVRVSIIPTTYGESIVMRLLKSSTAGLEFKKLGIIGPAYKHLEEQVSKPNGMIITTGPTGSGKTTTLYSILNKLNTEKTKIITLEDPVEYKLDGINQSQVDHSRGYDFADGLRSILRQDPDIVMVGEIRDLETADVAMNAALTGHLVVSTLHTNSAAAAIPRFISMGVKSFLLSPALNAIIGQRLVRRICDKCKTEIQLNPKDKGIVDKIIATIDPEILKQVDIPALDKLKFYKGTGCSVCHGIGFKGRIGIYEILIMNKQIEQMILDERVSEYDVEEIAKKQGMLTMVQDGIIKAAMGITTTEEVLRVAKTLE